MRTYLYKVKYDAGTAPCVMNGFLSLAICKPMIRKTAAVGDWVFGFGAKSTLGQRLIYIAQVTNVLIGGSYYADPKYAGRRDRIYRWVGAKLIQKRNAVHVPDDSDRDVGRAPDYDRAVVILSANFKYFGVFSSEKITGRFAVLMNYVSKVGQGHRVNLPSGVERELRLLAAAVWKAYPMQSVLGKPSHRVGCDR